MPRRPSSTLLGSLFVSLLLSASPLLAVSGYEELELCKAGKTMDKVCMQKHLGSLEKYVISGSGPYTLKSTVADALADYYFDTGQQPTENSRSVLSKRAAYAQAHAIDLTVFKSHYQNCAEGPGCEDGYSLDVSGSELAREKEIRIKEYFLTLDYQMFAPEVKYLEQQIKFHAKNM